MSLEDDQDQAANMEADAEQAQPSPALPTVAEVIAHAQTWGNTTDEVAAWLRDHGFTDNPALDYRRNSIIHNCVVAMALRAQFPALNESLAWMVTGWGAIDIGRVDSPEVGDLPAPVAALIVIADEHRENRDGPYPFLYAPTSG